jgi:hypothetical protein
MGLLDFLYQEGFSVNDEYHVNNNISSFVFYCYDVAS